MGNETIENNAPAAEAQSPKKRKPARKARHANKSARKTGSKPKADHANKKAEVIALMKRIEGASLAEIIKATGWQAHTIRGFVSILAKKGGEKIESSKSADGERTYKIK